MARLEAIVARIRAVREAERGRGEREAFVSFQLQAIEALSPQPGEMEELAAERHRLRHAGRLLDLTRGVSLRLDQGDGAICDEVARLASDLSAAAEIDPASLPVARALEGCRSELIEVARDVTRYAERTEADPARLSDVEERLYRLEGLLRQHGPTLEDVLATRDRLAAELAAFAGAESRIAELEREKEAQLAVAAERARKLSARRRKAAEKLGAAISGELAEMGMGGARVVVDVAALGASAPSSPSTAPASAPTASTASSSSSPPTRASTRAPPQDRLGRRALPRPPRPEALLAECGPAGLYVFDEVDAGVGGAVADKIGRAIADVAKHHQVLCITHLAPIAAFGDAHFVVSKQIDGGMTRSGVVRVERKERIAEVARMLSGAKVTDASLKAATEMIRAASGSDSLSARRREAPCPRLGAWCFRRSGRAVVVVVVTVRVRLLLRLGGTPSSTKITGGSHLRMPMRLRKSSFPGLTATLLLVAVAMGGCRKGASSGPLHRERAPVQDPNCREPALSKAFFYPAENRVDYGPDDPKKDGCALLVSDHLFCCPDVKRATDR